MGFKSVFDGSDQHNLSFLLKKMLETGLLPLGLVAYTLNPDHCSDLNQHMKDLDSTSRKYGEMLRRNGDHVCRNISDIGK